MPPREPRLESVTAMAMVKSALAMRLIQILRPLITQSLPSLTALVFMPAGSPPAPGSEMAMAELVSPAA